MSNILVWGLKRYRQDRQATDTHKLNPLTVSVARKRGFTAVMV